MEEKYWLEEEVKEEKNYLLNFVNFDCDIVVVM